MHYRVKFCSELPTSILKANKITLINERQNRGIKVKTVNTHTFIHTEASKSRITSN